MKSDAPTPAEQRVLDAVCKGLSNKMIVRMLGIGEGTVKCHMSSLHKKFQVTSRLELVVKVLNARIAELEQVRDDATF